MSDQNVALDLDTLASGTYNVKVAGQVIQVKPLDLSQLAELGSLQDLANRPDGKGVRPEDVKPILESIDKVLDVVAPEIKEKGITLNWLQKQKLISFVTEISVPKEEAPASNEQPVLPVS